MKWFLWVILAAVVLGGAYLYRNQITAMFSGASAPISYGPTNVTSTTSPSSNGMVITWAKGPKGQYATGPNGMTLYRFDKDTPGVSNCSGSCTQIWPPYTASAVSNLPANVSIITRSDGTMQFAYKGLPLYYYSGDSAPGDMKGDGFNGIWHVVTP